MLEEIIITDTDIDNIEKRWSNLTEKAFVFDDERRKVLKYWGSCEVQACPGRGKTTTLVAKLLLLLDKLPSNQGLCVLSHTNAAREEVIQKLGSDAERILKPPHFIGTIQNFVNQFLAIPGSLERFGTRPWIIDDDAFDSQSKRYYYSLPFNKRLQFDIQTGGKGTGWEYFSTIRYLAKNARTLTRLAQGKETPIKHGKHELRENTDTFKSLLEFKDDCSRKGYLAFHDAFSIGLEHLKNHPGLQAVFAHRFGVIFVDEVQDTDQVQNMLIQNIFGNRVHVQKFGDQNQSIFQNGYEDEQSTPDLTTHIEKLTINSTMRLSPSVARLSQSFGVNFQPLESKSKARNLPHTIFLFSDPKTVLPSYARLIGENLVDSGGSYYAVGFVGKSSENLAKFSIGSYFPSFAKRTVAPRLESFQACIDEAERALKESNAVGLGHRFLLEGFLQLLRKQGMRRENGAFYNRKTLEAHLRQLGSEDAYKQTLLKWITALTKNQRPEISEFKQDLNVIILPMLESEFNEQALDFINNLTTPSTGFQSSDVFSFPHNQINIEIKLATIHAVKGQTHDATLLLDTHSYGSELEDILPVFLNQRPTNKMSQARFPQRMKRAYVALTRAKHLICVAMRQEAVDDVTQKKLEAAGWSVIRIP